VLDMTYNVFGGTLNFALSIYNNTTYMQYGKTAGARKTGYY